MNKKLLTAAIGAALAMGPALASADVTFAGYLHASYDSLENDGTVGATRSGLSSNFSYFDIKGSEDLGGGMKSVFQIRTPLRVDDGVGGLGGVLYDTFIGLQGGFGTVRFGRMDSPVKDLSGLVNLFGTKVGDMRNVTGGGSAAAATIADRNFDNRFSNSVRYDSAKFGGLTFAVQAAAAEVAADERAVGLNVRWTDGPFALGFGHETHAVDGAAEDESIMRLVGQYKMGAITLAALYETMSDLVGVSGADADSMAFSVGYAFGNNTLSALFAKSELDTTSSGASIMAIGLDHALSKMTSVYASYAAVSNDTGFRAGVAGAGAHGDNLAAVVSEDQSGFSLGMIVKF